jgi:hypothetical protein
VYNSVNMCAFLARRGNALINKSLVCDDWINVPLGILMLIRMCAACVLVHDAASDRKLLVQPESKIDVPSGVAIVNDGIQSKVNANLSNL